jgi:glutathione S-transferase
MIKLFWAARTRAFRAVWMLEEAGCAYERVPIDIASGGKGNAEFLEVNPMAKVPALRDGEVMLAESGAICAYIADRYPAAGLAPAIGDPRRGRYLHWLFFAGNCIEPAYSQKFTNLQLPEGTAGWGSFDRVMNVLEAALARGPWILGDRFTAADVMLGADLFYGVERFKLISGKPAIEAYVTRCLGRPAHKRALAIDEGTS